MKFVKRIFRALKTPKLNIPIIALSFVGLILSSLLFHLQWEVSVLSTSTWLILILSIFLMAYGISSNLDSLLLKRLRRLEAHAKHTRALTGRAVPALSPTIEHQSQEPQDFDGTYGDVVSIEEQIESALKKHLKSSFKRIVRLIDHLDSCEGTLSHDDLKLLAKNASSIDALLIAWIYLSHQALHMLPLRELRRISSYARQLGYWSVSNKVLAHILTLTGSNKDRSALEYRENELQVYRGELFPSAPVPSAEYSPIPGHVLHIVGKALPKTQSGYTLRTHFSAMAQRRIGYQVSVATLIGESGNITKREDAIIDGVDYYGFFGPVRHKWLLSEWIQENVNQLSKLVADIRPSVLHAHSDFLNAIVARCVGSAFNIPVIYESRGFWEESWISRTTKTFGIVSWEQRSRHFGMPEAYSLRKQMESQMRSVADHVVTLADVMKSHIVELGGAADKVTVVPNAVNPSEFPVIDKNDNLLEELGIPKNATVVGYISSIVEYEGIDVLVRAFHEAHPRALESTHLLIVGDGPELEPLKKLVRELGTPRVHFTGRVPHELILQYYSIIDVFVVPRKPVDVCQLVTPLKPFEAFSSGRAVILSDVGALREIAEQAQCARLFKAGDHRSLAAEISELISDQAERIELGRRAAAWVRRERSWDRNAQAYGEVYERLGASFTR